jgi:hypothetical protein
MQRERARKEKRKITGKSEVNVTKRNSAMGLDKVDQNSVLTGPK